MALSGDLSEFGERWVDKVEHDVAALRVKRAEAFAERRPAERLDDLICPQARRGRASHARRLADRHAPLTLKATAAVAVRRYEHCSASRRIAWDRGQQVGRRAMSRAHGASRADSAPAAPPRTARVVRPARSRRSHGDGWRGSARSDALPDRRSAMRRARSAQSRSAPDRAASRSSGPRRWRRVPHAPSSSSPDAAERWSSARHPGQERGDQSSTTSRRTARPARPACRS